jgi:prepilin-type N-terminal cleavage/methylation domain-containing protein
MNTRLHQFKRAFTLLEVMVALAFVSILIAGIYSCWYSILKGSRVARESSAAVQRSRIAIRTLQDSLLCACMYTQNMRYYSFLVDSEGDYTTLSFVAQLPNTFPRSGRFGDLDVRRLTFAIEPGPDSQNQLVLRQSPLLMEPDKDESEHPLVLARDVNAFIVEFIEPRTGEWVTDWPLTNQLPRKVRITLGLGHQANYRDRPAEELVATVVMAAQPIRPEWQAPPNAAAAGALPGGPAGGTPPAGGVGTPGTVQPGTGPGQGAPGTRQPIPRIGGGQP